MYYLFYSLIVELQLKFYRSGSDFGLAIYSALSYLHNGHTYVQFYQSSCTQSVWLNGNIQYIPQLCFTILCYEQTN